MGELLKNKSTGEGFDMMAKMLPHMRMIMDDKELATLNVRAKEKKEMTVLEMGIEAFPVLMVKHREEVYGIMSAVTGKTAEEIDKQPLEDTMREFGEATSNEVMSFFGLCARMAIRM